MRRRFPLLILMAITSLAGPVAHARDGSGAADPAARAAIIYNFTRFSTWRDNRFASASSPVVLCIGQRHTLAPHLAAFDGRPVGARTLQLRRVDRFDSACHAAVLGDADANPATLASLTRAGVLTIGDSRGFISHGAIGLVAVGRQIRFEINNRIAQDAGVALSSRLLRLAVVVR